MGLDVLYGAASAGFCHPGAGTDAAAPGVGHDAEKPSMKPCAWTTLSLALMGSAVSSSELASLIDLPVASAALVPASQYREASSRAARTGSPVDIALGVAGSFEGSRQLIVQTNEGAESPSASRVTVIRDGLLDDAVRTERWDIHLTRTAAGPWEIRQVSKSWRCWRGAKPAGFEAQPCP
ncbi:MAG TPA: hypothetical protein VET87_15025 [Rubrivivax sp.]|jgi:hypothetical protein|nr:hypothetical protein [Rubrivivax sp.]